MKLVEAVALRIREILKSKNMSQYRLEKLSTVPHNTMSCLLNARYKSCNLSTLALIITALDMTISEFFNSPLFLADNLDI